MQEQRKLLPLAVTLAVLAGIALGALGFYFLMRQSMNANGSGNTPASASTTSPLAAYITGSSTLPVTSAVPTDVPVASTVPVSSAPAATSPASGSGSGSSSGSIDTSSWQTYTSYELGFSIQYPPDVTVDDTSDPTDVTFTFPSSYFSTAMKDTDEVSVSVTATCTPMTSFSDVAGNVPSKTVTLNGITYTGNQQSGSAAGTSHSLTTFDTNQNDSCYRISYSSSGPDDAGAFVTDPSQVAAMDASHTADAAHVQMVASAMIASFNFATTGAGENEAFYSSSQSGTAPGAAGSGNAPSGTSGTITLTNLSSTTVSVGNSLTLNGSGFSGGHTVVWISNGMVNGVLWGGTVPSDSAITATVSAQACTQDMSVTGGTCPSYLVISPGIYTLTVSNQNGTTGQVYVKVQ